MKITSPKTEEEFKQYYNLRWRILRKPWNQPEDNKPDDNDKNYYHIIATEGNKIAGVARLEFVEKNITQLRYMAVDDNFQNKGIGRLIIDHMEQYAKDNKANQLFLHARENAVGFYEKLGYKITEKSYLLFDSIQHYKMLKKL